MNEIKDADDLRLQPRNCPFCGPALYRPVGRGYDYDYRTTFRIFEYRRCLGCGVVFPDYEPIYGHLDRIYKRSYWLDTSRPIYRNAWRRQIVFRNGRLIKRLQKLADKKPAFRMIDVGSGRGDLFQLLKDFFPRAEFHSVDLTNEVTDPDVKHHRGYFEDCNFDGQTFDVITSQHNIEHLYSPADFLTKARTLLTDDGFVFVMTPNVDALEFRILKRKLYCAGYSIPRHLTLFNERAIRKMVDNIDGLQIEWLGNFFTVHHWMGLLHHIAYNLTRSDRMDRWFDFNNVLFSAPFYLFELLRHRMGCKTGVS